MASEQQQYYSFPPPPPPPTLAIIPLLAALCVLVVATLGLITIHHVVFRLCRGTRPSAPAGAVEAERTAAGDGVEPKTLDSIPVFAYTGRRGAGVLWAGQAECVVCLGEFEERDAVRVLPSCRHVFHAKCIDAWFVSQSSCPLCRASVVDLESPVHVAEVWEWSSRSPARC